MNLYDRICPICSKMFQVLTKGMILGHNGKIEIPLEKCKECKEIEEKEYNKNKCICEGHYWKPINNHWICKRCEFDGGEIEFER